MAVMKLITKERINGKFKKTYDTPSSPCDRLLDSPAVSEEIKNKLRSERSQLDPLTLADELESKLEVIFKLQDEHDKKRAEEAEWEQGILNVPEGGIAEISGFSLPSVANAPCGQKKPEISQKLARHP